MDARIPPGRPGAPDPVDRDALAVHLSKVLRGQPFAILLAALAWLGFSPFIHPPWALALWFAAVVALALWRYVQTRHFHKDGSDPAALHRWRRLCLVNAAISGIVWSTLGLLAYPQVPIDYQPLAPVILMGVAGAGAITLASIPPATPLFLSLLLLPNAAMLLSRAELRDQLTGWGLILTVLGLSTVARPLSRHLHEGSKERRRLEAALRLSEASGADANASSDAKRAFIATMSHAIRTPMNGIIGMTQLLGRSTLDDRQRKWVGTLEHSARHLRQILDDILDLSRIEAGKVTIHEEAFDPRELVSTACDLFRPSAHQKHIVIALDVAPSTPATLRGDGNCLRQILINLVGNAVDFTEAGRISVGLKFSVDGHEGLLDVSVQDSGPGIPQELSEAVFEPFSKAAGALSGNGHGTGLGLAISRRLASLMGGRLDLERGAAKGAVFRLRVPMAVAHQAAPQPAAGSEARNFDGMRALVVEDSISNQLVLQAALEDLGIDCECVNNGESALQRLEAGRFDVVLMDCEMPGEDGFTTCRRWRAVEAQRTLPRTPIAAVTANVSSGDRAAARNADMDGFLAKPFELDELARLLTTLTRAPDEVAS